MTKNICTTSQEDFLKLSEDPSEKFRKRKGATDRGKSYEDLYTAHLILKLVRDDNVKNFRISSNHDGFGAFDDVVLEVEDAQSNKKMYAIQLKHVENVKTLRKMALTDTSGNFSIQKYYKELQGAKIPDVAIQLIILTNQVFSVPDKEKITLTDDCPVEICRSQVESLINTSDTGNCYQFKSHLPGNKYEDFFNKFALYSNQVNVYKIKVNTLNAFKEQFACSEDIFEKYLQFVTEWSIFDGEKDKLTKTLMSQVITMLVVQPLMTPLTFTDDGMVTEERKLFREAISQFHVTVFNTDGVESLQKLWNDSKSKLPTDFGIVKKSAKRFQIIRSIVKNVNELTNEECNKLLWLMGVCPLVVSNDECIQKVLKLCPSMKFVVLDNNSNLDGFTKLSDLKQLPNLFDKIVSVLKFWMQGKKRLPLAALTKINTKVVDFVTTNELLQMSEDLFVVGGQVESLPLCHITRRLSRNVIDCQSLLRIENCALFISEFGDRSEFNSFNVIEVDKKFLDQHQQFQERNIYVAKDQCSCLLFQIFCNSIENVSNCHHFRQTGDNFEWLSSKNNLSEIRSHLQEGEPVKEENLNSYEFLKSLNIICADPGMGKTTLMQSLKNHTSPDFWTVLIYARSHSKHFRAHKDDVKTFQEYILADVKKNYSDFDAKIFEIMMQENLVRYMWDGLDEVSSENIESVLSIIDSLQKKGLPQWMTSRNNMKDKLENSFKVPSITLKEFDDNEQKKYIQDRLQCTEDQMITIFEKVKNNIQLFSYNDILGIPLQIFIITELFKKNMQKYLVILNEIFTIADLYDHFVDEKFQVYNIGKEKVDDDNDLVYERIQQEKITRVYQYEKAALHVYVPQELVNSWQIKCKKFLQELQNGKDRFGIVINVDEEDKVEFFHNSFGEYFTAQYLSKHLNLVPETVTFIFDDKHNNIRFFFDLMLATNRAHIAVLYRNPQLFSQCEKEEILAKDKGGRNSLQLISSWGVRCPPLPVDKEEDTYIVDKSDFDATKFSHGENENYRTILSQLVNFCQLEEVDDLFQMTSFSYASKSSSLLSLAMITCQSSILSEDFKTNSILVFFYSTLADYEPIFKIVETPHIKGHEFTLVDTQSVKCLQKVLLDENYKRNRSQTKADGLLFNASKTGNPDLVQVLIENGSNVDGKSTIIELMKPLIIAAGNGDYNIVKVLLDHDADVNVKNNYGTSALHAAVQSQDYDIVKLLIDHKAAINVPDTNIGTPLHYALSNGNYEIAKLLCKNGADVNQRPPHLKSLLPVLRFQMIEKKYPKLAELLVEYKYDFKPGLEERIPQLKQRINMVKHLLGELQRLGTSST